jgi:hypothetical protein
VGSHRHAQRHRQHLLSRLQVIAMKICIHKSTGRLFEAQSDATPGTLLANVAAAGLDPADYEERDADAGEVSALVAAANAEGAPGRRAAAFESRIQSDTQLRVILARLHDQESRLRAIEGRPAIKLDEYLAEVKAACAGEP